MNCERCRDWMLARPVERDWRATESEIRTHLNECPGCREEFESIRTILDMTRAVSVPIAPPDHLDNAIMHAARQAATGDSRIIRFLRFFTLPVPATAVALILVAAFTVLYESRHGVLPLSPMSKESIPSETKPESSVGMENREKGGTESSLAELDAVPEKKVEAVDETEQKMFKTDVKQKKRDIQISPLQTEETEPQVKRKQPSSKAFPMAPMVEDKVEKDAADGDVEQMSQDGAVDAPMAPHETRSRESRSFVVSSTPVPTGSPSATPTPTPSGTPSGIPSPSPTPDPTRSQH